MVDADQAGLLAAFLRLASAQAQQTNGMDQLAAAMNQIKQATTQTAASTKQTEKTVQSLISMAGQLEQAVAQYQQIG